MEAFESPVMDAIGELIERIQEAQELMLKEKLTANTVVLNGKKYSRLFECGYHPSICGLTAELAPLPDNMEFIVQYRVPQPKTNGDRIRSMSDEELAKFIAPLASCPGCYARRVNIEDCGYDCKKAWLDWLKEVTRDAFEDEEKKAEWESRNC